MNKQWSIPQNPLRKVRQDFETAWKRQEYRRSIKILERASQSSPADPCILLDLGRAHGMRYDYAAAEGCFEKAIRVSAWKTPAFVAAGLHCLAFSQPKMAECYFENALKKNGDSVEPLVQLAELYERQNRLDASSDLVDRAMRLDSSYASVLLMRAILDRHAGRLDQAESLLRSLVSKANPDTWTHARGWYGLGAVLDRQSRYDEAMAAFLEAKALMQPTVQKKIVEFRKNQEGVKKNGETILGDHLKRWHEASALIEPTHRFAVLCGHPRSGTTLLEQVLDSHPQIVSAEETLILHNEAYLPLTQGFQPETDSLLQILDAASPDLLRQSRAGYYRATERFLGNSIRDRLLVDKNPSLITLIPAIVRVFPEARFLVALRDPRDVCLSCFMQPLPPYGASVAYASLEETVTDYVSVMGFWRTISLRIQNPFVEVRYEDVVNDLESAARRAIDFLGVPWDACVLKFDEHARQKTVRSPTYADVKKPVFKTAVGRWRNYQKYLEPHLERLAPFVKAFGYE